MNQRIAAVRGLFEFAVITGRRDDCPVPDGAPVVGSASEATRAVGSCLDGPAADWGPVGARATPTTRSTRRWRRR